MKIYRVIIIDDEPPARQRLRELLLNFKNIFEIINEACNGAEGIEKIKVLNPDIIFLDIQMPDMSGFEMLQQLDVIPMVVFCTAFDEYSLKAFETNSLDYLLKPIRKERLQQTIKKLEFFKKEEQSEKILNALKSYTNAQIQQSELTSIAVRTGKKIRFIKLDDISYFKSGEKYVSIFTKEGQEQITDQTLIMLMGQLPNKFLRIHRSVIINTNMVEEVVTYFNSRYAITLSDKYKTVLKSGRSYQSQIKIWMSI